jgi:hypothetical protein
MKRPTYTIGACCDVHMTCADCGHHRHVSRLMSETVQEARDRAAQETPCPCEGPVPTDRCAFPTGCTKKRLPGLSMCRKHQPYPAR